MKLKNFKIIIFSIVAIYCSLFFQVKSTSSSSSANGVCEFLDKIKPNFSTFVLDNGLTVMCYRKTDTPEVCMNLIYKVGSSHEKIDQRGFSFMVSNLIFNFNKEFSKYGIKNYVWVLNKRYNAACKIYSSYDWTCYSFDTDKKNWPIFLNVFSDCMSNVRFDENEFLSVKKTIYKKIKEGDSDCEDLSFLNLFPKFHPYEHDIRGYKEQLLTSSVEDIKNFYKEHYRPDNACLIVVGDVDVNDLNWEVKNSFENIPKSEDRKNTVSGLNFSSCCAFDDNNFISKEVTSYKDVSHPSVDCLWLVPGTKEGQFWKIKVIAGLINDRLRRKLEKEKGLVSYVGSYLSYRLLNNVFAISFDPKGYSSLPFFSRFFNRRPIIDRCKSIIKEELEDVIENGFNKEEIERLKKIAYKIKPESFEFCNDIAGHLGYWYLFSLEPFEDDKKTILELGQLKPGDLKYLVQKYLRPFLMNIGYCLPIPDEEEDNDWNLHHSENNVYKYYDQIFLKASDRGCAFQQSDLSVLPNPKLPNFDFEKPDEEFTLSNGLQVILKKRDGVPFISGGFGFKNLEEVYSFSGLVKKRGSVSLVTELLMEGSEGYTKEQNEDFFKEHLATYYFNIRENSFSCLNDDFEVVASRFFHILTKPTYPSDSLKRVASNEIESIEKFQKKSGGVAFDILRRHFRRSSFWFKIDENIIEELKRCKRNNLFDLHRKYVTPQNMFLVIVGDFDVDVIKNQLENIFGCWKQEGCFAKFLKKIKVTNVENPQAKTFIKTVSKKRKLIYGACLAPTSDHPDYLCLRLLDTYFRESLLGLERRDIPFCQIVSALGIGSTENRNGINFISVKILFYCIDSVMNGIKKVLEDVPRSFSEVDLLTSKHKFLIDLAKDFNSNRSILSSYINLKSRNRSWDFYSNTLKQIKEITLNEVKEVAKKYLNVDRWSFVKVKTKHDELMKDVYDNGLGQRLQEDALKNLGNIYMKQ